MIKRNASSIVLGIGLLTLAVLIVVLGDNIPSSYLTDKQLLAIGYNSVVKIEIEEDNAITGEHIKGHGTGFVVTVPSREYLFVTNAHVCHSLTAQLNINLHGGADVFAGKILRFDEENDLCVLEPTSQILHHYLTPLHISIDRIVGDTAYIIGYPRRAPLTPCIGSIVGFEHAVSPMFISMVLSNRLYPGNSGSPILNDSGEVVGVAEAADADSNQGYGIPASYLVELLKGL